MMLDLYHAQIGEGNLIELVRRAGPLIGEVQVADVPAAASPAPARSTTRRRPGPRRAGLPRHRRAGGMGLRRQRARPGLLPRGLHRPRHPDRSAAMTETDPFPGPVPVATRASASGWSGPGPSGPSTGRAWPGGCRGAPGRGRRPGARGGRGAGRAAGLREATTDPAELLADPSVQAVVIAAPARFHADLVEAAAGAGKAVFCEPMALTLADADRAVAAAEAAGVPAGRVQPALRRQLPGRPRPGRRRPGRHPAAAALLTRDPGIPDPGRVPPSASSWRP